jgi:hypothetical protein
MYEIPMLAGMGSSRGLECFVQMLFVDCAGYTKCSTTLMAILMPSGDAVTVTGARWKRRAGKWRPVCHAAVEKAPFLCGGIESRPSHNPPGYFIIGLYLQTKRQQFSLVSWLKQLHTSLIVRHEALSIHRLGLLYFIRFDRESKKYDVRQRDLRSTTTLLHYPFPTLK